MLQPVPHHIKFAMWLELFLTSSVEEGPWSRKERLQRLLKSTGCGKIRVMIQNGLAEIFVGLLVFHLLSFGAFVSVNVAKHAAISAVLPLGENGNKTKFNIYRDSKKKQRKKIFFAFFTKAKTCRERKVEKIEKKQENGKI